MAVTDLIPVIVYHALSMLTSIHMGHVSVIRHGWGLTVQVMEYLAIPFVRVLVGVSVQEIASIE